MLPNARMQPKHLFFSLVRRMIATLIKCVTEKTSAHGGASIDWVAFSQDGTKLVSGSDDTRGKYSRCPGIKVWDSGALSPQIAPPWPKLTPAGLSGRCAGAVEREDERPQRYPQRGPQLGRVLPGRDQDCVRIVRWDDQGLGFRCAGALKIDPPLPKLTPAGFSGRCAGAVEREDGRAQRPGHVSGIFPGRDQDRVWIG